MTSPGPRSSSRVEWPKVVLFDLDDTLFDHDRSCRMGIAYLRRRDARWAARSTEELHAEYSRELGAIHPHVVAGTLSLDEARLLRFHRLARFCGFEIDEAEAARSSEEYRWRYLQARRTVPGARAVLDRLQGQSAIGVVTNNQVAEQHAKIRAIGLEDRLDFLVISERVGVSKPDPRIFQIALARAKARPEEAVMIGDSWASDVRGALGAGIRPIWFNRFHRTAPERADVPVIDSFVPVGTLTGLLARSR
ncbi:MAG: HAD family hydrolase [Thermoplasmata archaeon]